MLKIVVVGILGLLLVGFGVSCCSTYPSVEPVPQQEPIKQKITTEEWNQIFSDYRAGILSRQEASLRIKSSERIPL